MCVYMFSHIYTCILKYIYIYIYTYSCLYPSNANLLLIYFSVQLMSAQCIDLHTAITVTGFFKDLSSI